MIKTLAKAQQQERVKFRVPRSVQDAIPIRRIWSDGILYIRTYALGMWFHISTKNTARKVWQAIPAVF